MTIQLNSEQADRVAEAFRSGAYRSEGEVIDRAP
jgi:Arc/MetJ-type ribon-helix-helix transcriptional regulator